MEKNELNEVLKDVQALLDASSCCQEAKDAALAWKEALGTTEEKVKAQALLKELEEDIMLIDDLIGFAMSDAGKACFGEKMAQDISTHAQEIKAKGALYCDCPACQAAEAILKKKDLLLK